MTPLVVFRTVAVAEAVTWAGLLVGIYLKRVSETTDVGVHVFGMLHGVVFIAYCLVAVLITVDHGWTRRTAVLGLLSAVPPFLTIWFDRYAESRGLLDRHWHTSPETTVTTPQRMVSWLLRHRRAAVGVFAGAVAALTAVALAVGPPVG